MPQIDVSDILLDPELAGVRFTVLRRQETIDAFGRSQINTQTLLAIGSVKPTGENSLVRAEGFQSQAKTISVITRTLLRGDSKDQGQFNNQPDIVVWRENHYLVRTVDDYSQYGAGFIKAECTSVDYVDQSPSKG